MENQNIQNTTNQHNVGFMQLRGKFAYMDYKTGNPISDFYLTMDEVKSINAYLHGGVYEGMFDKVSVKEYVNALGLKYGSMKKDGISKEEEHELIRGYLEELNNLNKFKKVRKEDPTSEIERVSE